MRHDDWTQRLRDRLADFEETAPNGLWADIEARLPQPEAPRRQSRLIPLWRRWAVAASLAALLLSGGYLLWPKDERQLTVESGQLRVDSYDYQTSAGNPIEKSGISGNTLQKNGIDGNTLQKNSMNGNFLQMNGLQGNHNCQLSTLNSQLSTLNSQLNDSQLPVPDSVPSSPEPPAPLPTPAEVVRKIDAQIAAVAHHRRPGRPAFGLYAANGLSDQTNRNGVQMSASQLANYSDRSMTRGGSPTVWLYNYEERQHHDRPVSYGLTANFPISSSLSLTTGLVYTRLGSDFTYVANGYPFEKEQTLHYVGIPLTLQWRLWQWGGLRVYLAGGGQADWNVKNKTVSEGVQLEVGRDRWQFSALAALGLQYDVLPPLGVYVEPGLRHYFDNGSRVNNYFKDSPTNLILQVGVRLNLSSALPNN